MPSLPPIRIGVIGMGRVGPVIAAALRSGGHDVVAVSARTEASAERASLLLPGVAQLSQQEVVDSAEVVFLAVPDRTIESLADSLNWRPGQIAIHLSGALGLDVLESAALSGAVVASIHPVMTFQGLSLDATRLIDAPMAVTAPPLALPLAEVLAAEIGGQPFVLDDSLKPQYHAALTHAANHLVTVISQARDLLTDVGVEDPGAVLKPLTEAALHGALESGMAALTGPVERGDDDTVARHMVALSGTRVADTYRWLSRTTKEELDTWRAHETTTSDH